MSKRAGKTGKTRPGRAAGRAAAPAPASRPVYTRDAGTTIPPARTDNLTASVAPSRAMTLGAVYRAIQIIATVVAQFDLVAVRDGQVVASSLFLRQPEIGRTLRATLRATAVSLAAHGNAYWRIARSDRDGTPAAVTVLDPNRVVVVVDPKTGATTYDLTTRAGTIIRGLTPGDRVAGDIVQLRLLELPGNVTGLGPIQAARVELAGALDVRDWGSNWFQGSGVPRGGLLTTDQVLAPDQAAAYAEDWETARQANATAVLGKGLTYTPMLLNPADALWLDAQRFSVSAVARLFGMPSTWLLADAGAGGNLTYTNLQDARSDAILTTFLAYSGPIEEAFTQLTPRGQSAELRPDRILRASTNQRYASYTQGLNGGWLTIDEVRAAENLPPLTGSPTPTAGPPSPDDPGGS